MSTKTRRGIGLAVLSISLIIFLWGVWPWGRGFRTAPVLVQEKIPAAISNGAGHGARQLNIEWPFIVRVGDPGTIRFELVAGDTGLGPGLNGETADRWFVQARLDLPQVGTAPPGEVSVPLMHGRPVIFQWIVQPERTGDYQGMLWIYSRRTSGPAVEGNPAQDRQVLSTQRLEFRAISLFGLGGPQARILGVAGSVFGLLITLESFLVNFWKEKTFER